MKIVLCDTRQEYKYVKILSPVRGLSEGRVSGVMRGREREGGGQEIEQHEAF